MACVIDLTPDMLAVFETGVRYHLTHALGLLAVAWAASRPWPNAWTGSAGWLFVVGNRCLLRQPLPARRDRCPLARAITPIGGLCLIAGWVVLAVGALRGAS